MASATQAPPATLKQHYRGKNGVLYRSGTEIALIPPEAGIDIGENSLTGTASGGAPAPTSPVPQTPPTPAPPPATPPSQSSSPTIALPAGFPARALLIKAKLDTMEKVDEASDEELLAIEGIGDTTLKAIRESIK